MDHGETGQNSANAAKPAEEETEKDIGNVTIHKQNMMVLTAFAPTSSEIKALPGTLIISRSAMLFLAKVRAILCRFLLSRKNFCFFISFFSERFSCKEFVL